MTTLFIAGMWIVMIALMFGFLYLIGEVGFWSFCHLFGIVDRYLQDKHFEHLHNERMNNEKVG